MTERFETADQATDAPAPDAPTDGAQSVEAQAAAALPADTQIAELDQLIGELKEKVGALREGEFDASALETRLRELTDLASRAASTLDSVSR